MLILLVRCYQLCISPLLPRACIYEPTCSHYMIRAIQTRGAIRGTLLGLWRIARCHPFARGGYDPVPEPPGAPLPCPRSMHGYIRPAGGGESSAQLKPLSCKGPLCGR